MYHALIPAGFKKVAGNIKIKKQNKNLINDNLEKLKECDVIYERDAFHSFGIFNLQKKIRKPWVIECNGFFWGDMVADFHRPVFQEFYRLKHVHKWLSADHLIAVSSEFKKRMVSDGIPPEKISVIHNGVDTDAHNQVDKVTVNRMRQNFEFKDALVVGFIGSILPWHRIDLFLEAVKKLKPDYPVKGLIVGGGVWEEYRTMAKHMKLDEDVVFTGPVKPGEVPALVAVMDICTLPGSTDYNSPVKLFDYGAAQKPVLAADFRAVSEILTDHKTGLLFRKNDLDDYIRNLKLLLENVELRDVLGKSFYDKIAEDHSWEKVAQQTNQIIKQVADKRTTEKRVNEYS